MGRFQQGEALAGFYPVDDIPDQIIAFCADNRVHLRHLVKQILGIALAQAAGDDEFPMRVLFFIFGHLEDGIDGFRLSAFDEAAGIDDDHIGVCRIVGNSPVPFLDEAHHDF